MTEESFALQQLVERDGRYSIEAYLFIRDALSYAADSLQLSNQFQPGEDLNETPEEQHLTGQQLCHAIREYATSQFGYMVRIVMKNWGVQSTSDFGEIVYGMIEVGLMKKSPNDEREHFNDVYDFEDVFDSQFQITGTVSQRGV